ncbi:MAG: SEFIR domain-containing protein [Solirubrobacteraceae bacterium]
MSAVGGGQPCWVFVSYAHESLEHVEAVRSLWILLRSLGVDARLDLPAGERRQDWPVWMLREVRAAEFVLVVASREYRRRAEGDAPADEGRGVRFEAALIREEFYRDREAGVAKFVPVLLPGSSRGDIPVFLGPTTATSYAVEELTPAGVERLLRLLTAQPFEVEPPVGQVPVLPARSTALAGSPGPRAALAHELVLAVVCERGRVQCRTALAGTGVG